MEDLGIKVITVIFIALTIKGWVSWVLKGLTGFSDTPSFAYKSTEVKVAAFFAGLFIIPSGYALIYVLARFIYSVL
jgi:hypothetical protein